MPDIVFQVARFLGVRLIPIVAVLASTAAATTAHALASWVPFEVESIAANPVTNRVYGTARGTSGATKVYDESDGSLGVLSVDLVSLVVDPVNNRIYGAVRDQAAIAIVEGTTHAVTTVPLAAPPAQMAVDPVAGKLYVTLPGNGSVAIVDLSTHAVEEVAAGTSPSRIAVNAVTGKVYVGRDGGVTVIDGATHATTPIATGSVEALAVDVATNRIYALQYAALKRIDGASLAMTTISVADPVNSLAVNSLGNRVYVTSGSTSGIDYDGVVSVVNGTTMDKFVAPNGGAACCRLVVNMTDHQAYAAAKGFYCTYCPNPGPTTVIDGDTDAVTQQGWGAVALAANPATDRIYGTFDYLGTAGSGGRTLHAHGGLAARPNGLTTAITALPGNSTASLDPRFTFTPASSFSLPVQRVYYRVDDTEGAWLAATQLGGSWSGRTGPLAPGPHVLYAFAVDARSATPNAPLVGELATYAFTVTSECTTTTCVEVAVSHSSAPAQAFTRKDAVFELAVSNQGAAAASGVVLTDALPAGAEFVWASPSCAQAAGTVTCNLGTLAAGALARVTVVVRPAAAGNATNTATVAALQLDPEPADNQSIATVPVSDPPAAILVQRYRLYSPVTLEHHFTTDLNEYTVLGTYVGTWFQEGAVGKVLNNPGSFGGITATPYYRLYDTSTRWHHWTTDANEYYTLGLYGNWNQEGVDGWILPTQATGTTPLYRLTYPHIPGLHHWTIEAYENATLINSYGWIGEPGSGFVVQ